MQGVCTWCIRTNECDPSGHATLPAILNLLQEAASLNAEELGFSKSNFALRGENISWVLTRIRLQMSRYPKWEESVRVSTWPRGGRRIVAWRDFEIHGADGARLGLATSEWMLIDLATRRIVPVPADILSLVPQDRPAVLGPDPFTKLRWTESGEGGRDKDAARRPLRFRAKRSDIDLNGHVNNVHYAEWCLEAAPAPAALAPREIEMAFKSETFAGDEVLSAAIETEPGVFLHRVYAPDGRDHALARTRW